MTFLYEKRITRIEAVIARFVFQLSHGFETIRKMKVTILESRHVPAILCQGAQVRSLSAALVHSFRSDAHFQCGFAASARRFKKSGPPVTMTALAFDFDPPDHVATPEWRAELKSQLRALLRAHPGGYVYSTRNGFRVVYAVEPVQIASEEDAREWARLYRAILANLRRRFGLVGDASCADHSRLFRLPRVTRPPAVEPEVISCPFDDENDPGKIAVLDVQLEASDWAEVAPKPAKITPTPLCGTPRSEGEIEESFAPRSVGVSHGLLHRLLDARGNVRAPYNLGEGKPAAFLIRCPRAKHHTTGGDDALLIAPHDSGPGYITCRHHHCADLTPQDWLSEFTPAEIAAAGIVTRTGLVVATFVNVYGPSSLRLCVELKGDDKEPMPYVRVSPNTSAWLALWAAAGVEPPTDLDAAGDLGLACEELRSRRIAVELLNGKTRRILAAA